MGYPTGVYAPATKVNGQVIQPAFFNDPEAEIVAVENALLNGLPHGLTISTGGLAVSTGSVNIGGPSSLATLQVNGASTFSSAVAFNGAVTFSTGVTFSTLVTFHPAQTIGSPDLTVLTGSTSQFANGSSGGVMWPTQTVLTNSSAHSTATDPDRLAPQSTGAYQLQVTIAMAAPFADPSTGTIDLIIKDSSGGRVDFNRVNGSAGGRAPSITGFGIKRFDTVGSTNYLRVVLTQRGGSTASLDGTGSFLRFYKL